ncbi:MAG: helix-turn-helix domain-containing protein [Bryobacteraceae bacterium]
MASTSFAPNLALRRRIRMAEIDAAVSVRLGPTRGLGNSQPACFNRQVAMYLAKHVGRWSTKIIGRFYDGRDHSTVCYGIQRIEALRESDPDVEALITDLKRRLSGDDDSLTSAVDVQQRASLGSTNRRELEALADLIAARVLELLEKRSPDAPDRDTSKRIDRTNDPGPT